VPHGKQKTSEKGRSPGIRPEWLNSDDTFIPFSAGVLHSQWFPAPLLGISLLAALLWESKLRQ